MCPGDALSGLDAAQFCRLQMAAARHQMAALVKIGLSQDIAMLLRRICEGWGMTVQICGLWFSLVSYGLLDPRGVMRGLHWSSFMLHLRRHHPCPSKSAQSARTKCHSDHPVVPRCSKTPKRFVKLGDFSRGLSEPLHSKRPGRTPQRN